MGRPAEKTDLISAANSHYAKLNDLIHRMTEKELSAPFNFENDNRKEAHWTRDKNLRDVLIHLYEWHQLLLNWVHSNRAGQAKPFLPEPCNWKTYGEMNVALWKKHQTTPLAQAKIMLQQSHQEVMQMAETFSNDELFSKGSYPWVGGSTLGSCFISTTASHYDWAVKKLKAHIRNCQA